MADLLDDLYPAPVAPTARATTVTHVQGLVEQIALDTKAAKDPLTSDSDRAFFYERIAAYKAEYFKRTA